MVQDRVFYVFYCAENDDKIECYGTATDLVEEGRFPSREAVQQRACRIKSGNLLGAVSIVSMPLNKTCQYCGNKLKDVHIGVCKNCFRKLKTIRRYKIWRDKRED